MKVYVSSYKIGKKKGLREKSAHTWHVYKASGFEHGKPKFLSLNSALKISHIVLAEVKFL